MSVSHPRRLCLLSGVFAPLLALSVAHAQIHEEKPLPGLEEGVLFDKRSALEDLVVSFRSAPFAPDGSPDPFDSSAERPADTTPKDTLPKSDDRPMIGAGDFSIVCNFCWKPGPGGLNGGVYLSGASNQVGGAYTGWNMLLNTDRRIHFTVFAAGSEFLKMRTPPLELNTSGENLVIVSAHRDARQPGCGIWVNGVEVMSGALPPVDLGRAVPEGLLRMRNPHATHLRIYNRALTRPEILELTLRGQGTASDKPKPKHPAPPPDGPRFIPQEDETIALIGGTEAVALAESGELEALLLMAFPQTKFHFRCLAWEGDTVFRQDRPMNFGSLEQQLRRVNAGAVFVMFGRQECLDAAQATPRSGAFLTADQKPPQSGKNEASRSAAGAEGVSTAVKNTPLLEEFKTAFGKLLDTVAKVTPNIVVIGPAWFEQKGEALPDLSRRNADLNAYNTVLREVGEKHEAIVADVFRHLRNGGSFAETPAETRFTSDGVTLSEFGAGALSRIVLRALRANWGRADEGLNAAKALRPRIAAKNRLWHDYWRPSNWAFLHGDRTTQPSSRDPVNPQVRLFPAEQEKYLPLIKEAEEKIHQLVQEAQKKLP